MCLLVGRQAPDFVAPARLSSGAIVDRYRLYRAIKGKYALLFINPSTLTWACSCELSVLDQRADEFRGRDVEVLGVTIAAQHQCEIVNNMPRDHLWTMSYPLIVDINQCICRDYGLNTAIGTLPGRGAFLIDPRGIVRYQAINDLPLDHELDDLLDMVDALQTQGISTGQIRSRPAAWRWGFGD